MLQLSALQKGTKKLVKSDVYLLRGNAHMPVRQLWFSVRVDPADVSVAGQDIG
jgi:hypothetical protein